MNLEGATNRDYAELAIKLGEEFGCLDGILHNAAELRYLSRLDDYDLEHWFRVMQVNLNGPFMMTQACLPLLRKSGDPSVVFTSDSVGRQGKAYWGAYGVSKFAIEGLMQIMAAENDNKGPRVNSIDPGPVRTALRAAIYPGEDPNDLPAPDEVVKPYLWLLGADSQGVTGQAIG
jgi:NAD(P)-dependent dehydrogenase (short-subunit alcohol dehydrogenase family)